MTDIHVISLQDSPRRASIASALRDHGVAFRFADAVDARRMQEPAFAARYDDHAAHQRYGRSLTRAEVACFASHRAVWQQIAQGGRGAIVLEDDALLMPPFFDKVLRLDEARLAQVADIVQLGRSKLARSAAPRAYFRNPLKHYTAVDGLRIGFPFKQWTSGAVGYWISVAGARRALDYSQGPVTALLDDWPWHRDHGGMRIAELRPYVVWEQFAAMPSNIEPERHARSRRRPRWQEAALEPIRTARALGRWAAVGWLRATSIARHRTAGDQ